MFPTSITVCVYVYGKRPNSKCDKNRAYSAPDHSVDDDQSVEEEGQQTQADRHIQEQLRGTEVRPEALLEQLRAIQQSAESGRELRVLFVMPRETRP